MQKWAKLPLLNRWCEYVASYHVVTSLNTGVLAYARAQK